MTRPVQLYQISSTPSRVPHVLVSMQLQIACTSFKKFRSPWTSLTATHLTSSVALTDYTVSIATPHNDVISLSLPGSVNGGLTSAQLFVPAVVWPPASQHGSRKYLELLEAPLSLNPVCSFSSIHCWPCF